MAADFRKRRLAEFIRRVWDEGDADAAAGFVAGIQNVDEAEEVLDRGGWADF